MTARTARSQWRCRCGTTTGNESHPRTVDICARAASSPSTRGWHRPRLLRAPHSARQHHAAGDGTATVGDDGDVMLPDLALAGFAS